jgi:hypothetical protein
MGNTYTSKFVLNFNFLFHIKNLLLKYFQIFSRRSKKDPVVQQQSSNSNIVRGTVLSNIPGVSAPPTFVISQETDDKPISPVNVTDKPNEKNQIDSLPRHTAGSAELVRTIAVNREKAIQKSASDESKDLDSLNLDQYFQKPSNKIKPQSTKQEQCETHDNDNKPSRSDPEVSVSSQKISSYLNSLAEIDKQNPTENQTTNPKNRRSHKERRRRPRPDDDRSSSSDQDSIRDDIKYSSLNQKKNRLYKDLISLNQIENNQKRKILEQERELKIQNMKLNDALLVKKCVKNFQSIDANDNDGLVNGLGEGGYTRVPSYTYKNANWTKDKRPRSAMASNQKPSIRFPTIITKYEPQTYSRHAAGKRASRPSNDTVDLYLETIEDLVDASGQIISTKQSFKFIGKTAETSRSDLEPKVIYEHHSPINDTDSTYVTYPRMSSVYESSRHGGSLQKLTTSQLGAYEVITVDPNESKISRTVGGDTTMGLSRNYSKHLASPSRLLSHELLIDSPKTQLDDSEIKEILRIVDEKQRKIPSNHPSKYGIHRLSENASLLEKRIRAGSCRTETPKASARIVDNKSSPMTKSVNHSYVNDNFVLASGPSSYTIQRQPVQQSKPLDRNRSMQTQQPNVLRTQSLRAVKPELSSTTQASLYLNTDSTQSIIRTINEMENRDSAAKKPGFKSIATDTANNQLNHHHPIKNQVFKSIYQMEKLKPRESTISLSPHRSTFASDSNLTTQNQNEVDLKTIDYSATNMYHDQRYMLRKLAQAKDGDFIVKDKANEDVWNPSFLSAIPNNFDANANDTSGTFGTLNYN